MEIFPKYKGNQIWGTEIAHIVTHDVPGTYQILIYTEFGTATATATVSLLETNPNVQQPVKEEADQSSTQTTTIQDLSNRVDISAAAPLKQVAQGVLPNEIICKEELELIIKNNGSPACVKLKTAEILIERGWAKQKQKQIELQKETEEREQEKFDPVIVSAAKKNIPGMANLPKEILKQCRAVNSVSDYETFMLAVMIMEQELLDTISGINSALTTLELLGYDEHPEVGPLIRETRSLATETSTCLDEMISKYGS